MKQKIVYVDIEFTRIGEIDNVNEKFYADILILLSWKENFVIEQHYDKDKHWNPEIYIENLFSKPEETIEYFISIEGSVTFITEKRRIKVKTFRTI
jgi:hypothetical protein